MFGFPDYAECPVDKDDFSKSHHACIQGGPLKPHPASGSRGLWDCENIFAETDATEFFAKQTNRITVNKTTHRIRFENETESSVDVVIEPKG